MAEPEDEKPQNDRRDPEYLRRLAEVIAQRETALAHMIDIKMPNVVVQKEIGMIYRLKDELKAKDGEHLLEVARTEEILNRMRTTYMERTALGELRMAVEMADNATTGVVMFPSRPFTDDDLNERWQGFVSIFPNTSEAWGALYALLTEAYYDWFHRLRIKRDEKKGSTDGQ